MREPLGLRAKGGHETDGMHETGNGERAVRRMDARLGGEGRATREGPRAWHALDAGGCVAHVRVRVCASARACGDGGGSSGGGGGGGSDSSGGSAHGGHALAL